MKQSKIDDERPDESLKVECFYEVSRYLRRHGRKHDPYSKYARFIEFILMGNKVGDEMKPWKSLPERKKRYLIKCCSSRSSVERIDAKSARDSAKMFRHFVDIHPKIKGAENSPTEPLELKRNLYEAKTVAEAIRIRDEYHAAELKYLESVNELRNDKIRENLHRGYAHIQTLVSDPFGENAAVLVVDDLPDCLGRQTIAFRIYWKDGIKATLGAMKSLLQEIAPQGTPGAHGLPEIDAGRGKGEKLQRVRKWLAIVEMLDAKHTAQYVHRKLGCDLKTIKSARTNLEDWLQRQLGTSSRNRGRSSSHAGK